MSSALLLAFCLVAQAKQGVTQPWLDSHLSPDARAEGR